MSDLIQISTQIQHKIKQLDSSIKELSTRAKTKAESIANYEKALALTLIQLKNGVSFEIDGEIIQNPSATSSEKIARGIIYREKLGMETAEVSYKNLICGIQCIQAQLNGLQSILKYLQ
jgi:hypothetical protein